MATIKNFTDIDQSKKLAEILPLESADMSYMRIVIAGDILNVPEEMQYKHEDMPFTLCSGIGIPCWSLATLLNMFDDESGLTKDYNLWFCYDNITPHCTKHYINSIDAVFEMIVWLKENEKL